jgi:hypothetical protein
VGIEFQKPFVFSKSLQPPPPGDNSTGQIIRSASGEKERSGQGFNHNCFAVLSVHDVQ